MNKRAAKRKIKTHIMLRGEQSNFEVTPTMIEYWWRVLNKALFDDQLRMPKKFNAKRWKTWWGECETKRDYSKYHPVEIGIHRDIGERKGFITVLAHEMVHQWEQQTYGYMRHGRRFWSWKPKLRELGIDLEESY